jgi:hypothetical protein
MKTLNKLSSLFQKLDKADKLIDKHQKSLQHAPYREIQKALSKELVIRSWLVEEIIKVSDMVSNEVELERIGKELEHFELNRNINSFTDFNYLNSLRNKKFQLESDINAID